MPRAADSAEGMATVLFLGSRVLKATARQAPHWAKFAAEAMGIQIFRLPAESSPASMTLYMWCRPQTTVTGYSAPMTSAPMPCPTVLSCLARPIMQFSAKEKQGPRMVKVTKVVISTVHSGVTKRSNAAGTRLRNHRSSRDMSQTAMIAGITCP